MTKLSSAPKTTLGRIIIESGKFLVTKISPFNLDLAYLEFFILLTPSADKWINFFIFTYFDISKTKRSLEILKNQLAYTFCQVPILYTLSKQDCRINLILKDNSNIKIEGNFIDQKRSRSIFNRDGSVTQIQFQVHGKFLFNNNI